MKIGILGGTFNPLHIGHLILAEYVRDKLKLNKVIFIPCNIPPHKFRNSLLKAQVRLKILKRTLRKSPYFKVSDIEIKRRGISYTVDTLKALKRKYHKDKLFLIIGSDLLKSFNSWKEPATIKKLAKVVVVVRGRSSKKKGFIFINMPKIEVSSSLIRRRLRDKKSIRYLVPEEVNNYIKGNKRSLS